MMMTKASFYEGKTVRVTEWWLDECALPALRWARLRVFDDGSADAAWEEGGNLYGFISREYASFFLAEDEHVRFAGLDAMDEAEHKIRLGEISPPTWQDNPEQGFDYLGTY
jgi:hypothetical protein